MSGGGLVRPDELLVRSARLCRDRWKPALAVLLLVQAAFLAAFLAAGAFALGALFFAPGLSGTIVVLSLSSASAFCFFAVVWGQAALLLVVTPSNPSPGLVPSLETSWRRLPGFFLACSLYFAACIGGGCLFVLPGLAAGLWLVFGSLIYLTEDIGPVDALLKSRHYQRGRSWGVLGRLCAVVAAGSLPGFIPVVGFLLQMLAWPFVLMCLAALLEELRGLRGSEPFVPGRREKTVLAVVSGCSAIPLLLLPWALPWLLEYLAGHSAQLFDLLIRSR